MKKEAYSEGGSRGLQRNPKIEEAPLQKELMLFDPETSQFFVLNGTMAAIWRGCQENSTPADIVERLTQEFEGVDPAAAEADVRQALEDLISKGLLIDLETKSP
ncbi:MAG TPA: PqqD family protein [Thermoanaerobaculia bacterium]|nr:PqqD family protein [Thermoanaerobaculia bacterium]